MSFARTPSPVASASLFAEAASRSASAHEAGLCLHEVFETQVRRTPDAIALRFGAESLTYRELDLRAECLATELRARGVGPDALVGLCAGRSLETIIALVAVLKAGGAYVAFDPEQPEARLGALLEQAQPRVLLTQSAWRSRAAARLPHLATGSILCLDAPLARDVPAPTPPRSPSLPAKTTPEHLAYVAFTSGSSGKPKGVAIPHRGVTRLVCGVDYVALGAGEVFLQLAPLSFDASTFEIWGALLNGGQLVVMPPASPSLEEIGRAVREHGVTTLWLTAGLFHAMVEHRLEDLRGLRQLLAGGDVLSSHAVARVRRELPACRMINGYGPTECTTFACCHTVDALTPDRPVPIGRPIARTRVRLLDERLQPVPVGALGEIHLGGDGLARGYLNDPALTAEKFIADPFAAEPGAKLYRTGDLARMLSDGNLEFVGRRDRQLKVRGFRIEPGEIEATLAAHPEIGDVVVTAFRETTTAANTLVAYIVPRHGHAPTVAELREFLREQLPDYMMPARVVPLAQLPLTPSGKVDRHALPDPHVVAPASATAHAHPSCATELRLQRIWARVLGVPHCSLHDNFFDLGGHSLLAAHAIEEINRAWGCDLRVTALWQHPTIARFAAMLQKTPPPSAAGALFEIQKGQDARRRPLYFVQLDAGNFHLAQLASLLTPSQPAFGTDVPLSAKAFTAAAAQHTRDLPTITEIAARHTALILEHQPTGPCLLAGYCYTSILACEVAAQLARHGRLVETVFLLEPPIERLGRWRRLHLLARSRLRLWQLRLALAWSKANSPLLPVLAKFLRARVDEQPQTSCSTDATARIPALWTLLDRIQLNAVDRHRLTPLPGRAVIFNAQATMAAFHAADRISPLARGFAGGVEIIETPGDHWTLVKEPNLAALGERFNRALARAQTT